MVKDTINGNILYIINKFKEIFVNFVGIKSKFKKYKIIFASKFILHENAKKNYIKAI